MTCFLFRFAVVHFLLCSSRQQTPATRPNVISFFNPRSTGVTVNISTLQPNRAGPGLSSIRRVKNNTITTLRCAPGSTGFWRPDCRHRGSACNHRHDDTHAVIWEQAAREREQQSQLRGSPAGRMSRPQWCLPMDSDGWSDDNERREIGRILTEL